MVPKVNLPSPSGRGVESDVVSEKSIVRREGPLTPFRLPGGDMGSGLPETLGILMVVSWDPLVSDVDWVRRYDVGSSRRPVY